MLELKKQKFYITRIGNETKQLTANQTNIQLPIEVIPFPKKGDNPYGQERKAAPRSYMVEIHNENIKKFGFDKPNDMIKQSAIIHLVLAYRKGNGSNEQYPFLLVSRFKLIKK